MLYALHDTMRAQARFAHAAFTWSTGWQRGFWPKAMKATAELAERSTREYGKPSWGELGDPEVISPRPFGDLIRFPGNGPKILVVAAMSGHYATLLRPTIIELQRDHDVYVTDWANARDVPRSAGPFDLDTYIGYLVDWIEELGDDTHILAVCQAAVPVLAAVTWLAQVRPASQPASMALMSGPISPAAAHTSVTEQALQHPLSWFRRMTSAVPLRYRGAGRRVYPGFLQLAAFLGLNPGRHLDAHWELLSALREEDRTAADKITDFYDEYFAVCDMTAEFYLSTIERVFRRHEIATGRMMYAGVHLDPGAIDATALMTIEGGRDDICAPGQTAAAHELCSSLPERMRAHHLEPQAGHYGTFSGTRWRNGVAPALRAFVRAHERTGSRRPVRVPATGGAPPRRRRAAQSSSMAM